VGRGGGPGVELGAHGRVALRNHIYRSFNGLPICAYCETYPLRRKGACRRGNRAAEPPGNPVRRGGHRVHGPGGVRRREQASPRNVEHRSTARRNRVITHRVRTHASSENLPREEQLAWKLAEVAADPVAVRADVAEMIGNRVIDNAAVAAASLARRPVANARAQALAHPY